ncbi:hypothetical protein QCA50_015810 [Cerrena zonata]|uniref:Uncharacterized protein n=1 Tax=Cerrena zonata TaxID=2478898 RepID=A0AAW0FNQ6_9APHY
MYGDKDWMNFQGACWITSVGIPANFATFNPYRLLTTPFTNIRYIDIICNVIRKTMSSTCIISDFEQSSEASGEIVFGRVSFGLSLCENFDSFVLILGDEAGFSIVLLSLLFEIFGWKNLLILGWDFWELDLFILTQ